MAHLDTVDGVLLIELEDDEVRTRGAEVEGGRLSVKNDVADVSPRFKIRHISSNVL